VADDTLRRGVISLFHDHKASGHPGITKTLQLVAPYYWWPNMLRSGDLNVRLARVSVASTLNVQGAIP
jgi:hypothetical protein